MNRSNRIKRIFAAILLTAVLAANAFQIGTVANERVIKQAALYPSFYMGKKVYNPDGSFKGCIVPGTDCIIIASALGKVTISSEGIAVQ